MKEVPKQNPPAVNMDILRRPHWPRFHRSSLRASNVFRTAWNTVMGRDLILLDTHANLIVDFIPRPCERHGCDDDASNVCGFPVLARSARNLRLRSRRRALHRRRTGGRRPTSFGHKQERLRQIMAMSRQRHRRQGKYE